jgi:hypothetical protein
VRVHLDSKGREWVVWTVTTRAGKTTWYACVEGSTAQDEPKEGETFDELKAAIEEPESVRLGDPEE